MSHQEPGHRFIDRVLWFYAAALGAIQTTSAIFEYNRADIASKAGLAIGIIGIVVCVAGLALRWGPVLPCTILGMLVAWLLGLPVSKNPSEAASEALVTLYVGIGFGTMIGVVLELRPPSVETEGDAEANAPNRSGESQRGA